MKLSERPLLSAAAIQRRVDELGAEIAAHYGDMPFTMVVVLKGALPFAADLMRAIDHAAMRVEYIRARSYDGTDSTGEVALTVLPEEPLQGRHVLLVEDILDTGRTARVILEYIDGAGAASCAVCTLLDKPARRETPIVPDFCGFTIDNHFVVGYGLDFNERHRELPAVFVLEEAAPEEADPASAIEAALEPKREEPFVWPQGESGATPAASTPEDPGSGQSADTPTPGTEAARQAALRARTRRRRGRRPYR